MKSINEGANALRYHAPALRLTLVREAPGAYRQRPIIRSPESAAAAVQEVLGSLPHERFVVLLLDSRGRLLGVANVSDGSMVACPVDIRLLFATVLLAGAARIIVAHGHPSGDPSPSQEDKDLTRRLVEAGQILGVPVDDHVIIGGTEHHSLRSSDPMLFRSDV
jgi:DNA repair protein RadC